MVIKKDGSIECRLYPTEECQPFVTKQGTLRAENNAISERNFSFQYVMQVVMLRQEDTWYKAQRMFYTFSHTFLQHF